MVPIGYSGEVLPGSNTTELEGAVLAKYLSESIIQGIMYGNRNAKIRGRN